MTCGARSTVERKISMAAHLAAIAIVWTLFGFYAALRTNIIPVFFIFPIAFTLNRLGQHYDIDPADPAKWGTLMRGHWFWDFAFLNSNYHLEHHYFPGVPFYRLPRLQRALVPFYEHKRMRWQTYGRARLRLARRESGAAHRLALEVQRDWPVLASARPLDPGSRSVVRSPVLDGPSLAREFGVSPHLILHK